MFLVATGLARAQHNAAVVRTVRTAEPPHIDGRLSEEVWAHAPMADRFTQRDPNEGQPPTERTEIRVLYDEDALYFGARLFDSLPASISRRLSPRDEPPDSDYIVIYLDPRHDHRTGVAFTVTAAGVQRDIVISNDTFENASWDAVWTSAVSVDAEGWSVEMRIPLSQLRFNAGDAQTWGINVSRHLRRANETMWLELVLKNENGLASRMAHLIGLEGIRARRQIEFAPYTALRQEFVEPDDPADPLNDGARVFGSIGLDVKAPLPGGLTLDATINPDFGQAEVDPAVVNLSAFETFFQEKRRFFIEGAEIFNNFGAGGSNNFFGFNTSDPEIFYSRRIGRAPQGDAGGDFADVPRAATILGAAKLTGKTAGGWSIGIIEALTGRERARVIAGSIASRRPVEPLTNYFVARVQRDFTRGGAGVLTTAVNRQLETPDLSDLLTRRAFVFGGDAHFFFDRARDWVVTGKLSGSRVSGSEAAIEKLQRAPQRYYQRPDAPQVSFDPRRTSLSGYAGRVNLNRNSGVWRVNAALWGVSPGFESNDLGFHGSGDRAGGHGVLLWSKQQPDRWTRYRGFWAARAWTWNFNRELLNNIWFGCASAQFLNYWFANGCLFHGYRSLDDRLTRGGVIAVNPHGNGFNGGFSTDGRKRISLDGYGGYDSDEFGGWSSNNGVTVSLKGIPSLTISAGPQLNRSRSLAQYVDTFGDRPVFATIDQRQLSMITRVNWTMNPRTSLQVFMQPLLATGGYDAFKELAAPRTFDFREFRPGPFLSFDGAGGRYTIDPDEDGPAEPFSFDDPDFNFKSLRLNAVFRWEFRPGSTLYAVWTEQREDDTHPGSFQFRRDAKKLFAAPSDDVFLVKMTYWLGR
jgi:hypothetical protein